MPVFSEQETPELDKMVPEIASEMLLEMVPEVVSEAVPIFLESMTPIEFDAYIKKTIPVYAEHMVEQGEYFDFESAVSAAASEVTSYYRNIQSPEERVFPYHITHRETKKRMGYLVYSYLVGREPGEKVVFIDYIEIFSAFQRKGYARCAMQLLEQQVRADTQENIRVIDLNVMLYNTAAQKLYTKLGYDYLRMVAYGDDHDNMTRVDMRKNL